MCHIFIIVATYSPSGHLSGMSVAVDVMLSCKHNLFLERCTPYHRSQARGHWQANWVGVVRVWLCVGDLKELDTDQQPPVDQVGILDLWRWRHCVSLKCQKPLTQWHSVTSQMTWILKENILFLHLNAPVCDCTLPWIWQFVWTLLFTQWTILSALVWNIAVPIVWVGLQLVNLLKPSGNFTYRQVWH
jgi:hypothetical protein